MVKKWCFIHSCYWSVLNPLLVTPFRSSLTNKLLSHGLYIEEILLLLFFTIHIKSLGSLYTIIWLLFNMYVWFWLISHRLFHIYRLSPSPCYFLPFRKMVNFLRLNVLFSFITYAHIYLLITVLLDSRNCVDIF